jgi:hypothetical protein
MREREPGVLARDNPFAAHRVLEVRFRLSGRSWEDLLARLARLRYRAAIVGLRGAGKTTLLEDLELRLPPLGFRPRPLRLDQEHRRLERSFEAEFFQSLGARDVVLLDGAEQMPRLAWWRFRRRCRTAAGLVITSHHPGRLPTLIECQTTPALLGEIVAQLLGDGQAVSPQDIQRLHIRHRGNLRDALRELYDWFSVASRPLGH